MNDKIYCPIFNGSGECRNVIATKQSGKFKPDKIVVKCSKCGKYITYDYKKNEFFVTRKYFQQDSSGKRFY